MLDIILDVSESDFPPLISERIKQNNKFRKAYTENGARVYRHVRDELRKIAPELARPNGKEETRGAQKDLHKLYTGLRTIAIWDQLHE
jgi:hypothetical protein